MNHDTHGIDHEFWDLYMDSYLHDAHYHRPAPEPEPARSEYATDNMIVLHEIRPTLDNVVAVR